MQHSSPRVPLISSLHHHGQTAEPRRSATRNSSGLLLATLVLAIATSGASCPQFLKGYQYGTLPLPRTLPANASLEQIIQVVHDNTSRVRTYMAPQATLSVPGVPKLSAQVACEPPRRFRLRAQTAVTGSELDIGSNDDLFWLWIRRHEPPVLLFCRHDQYAQSSARRLLPLKADWMPELLGLVSFRPDEHHDGPFPLADGKLEIRSRIRSDDGELTRSTLLDGTTGLVLEQHLFSPTGERLASVRTSKHRVDQNSGAALPRRVEVSWPASGIDFTLDIANLSTNTPSGDPGLLWQMPAYEGYEPVDLADPSVMIAPQGAGQAGQSMAPPAGFAPPL